MRDGDRRLPERALDPPPPEPSASPTARQKIVAAAYAVLSQRGSHETSIKEVARAAGVAPGLVHYYFASKGELLLETVREACRTYRGEMAALTLPDDPVESTRALLAWSKRRGLELPDWYRLIADLDALALRDASFALEVAVLHREVREHTASLVAEAERKVGANLGVGHAALASVIIPAIDGLIVQKLVDPEFDLDAGFDALARLLVALLSTARPA